MAHFRQLPSGLWQAQIEKRGIRKSESFKSKTAAKQWAAKVDGHIDSGEREIPNDLTVADLLKRYQKEVTPSKKGKRWEDIRLEALGRDLLASVRLTHLDTPHVGKWQESRLEDVSGASVRRERNLLNHVFEIARKEWRLIKRNPFEGLRKPKDSKARNRIATQEEIDKVMAVASPALQRSILIALETAMRASEIASVKTDDIKGRVVTLHDSKNGHGREIPLSTKAVKVWEAGPIEITADSISTLWAQACKEAKVEDLHFHDLRRSAIVRLAAKLPPMELAIFLLFPARRNQRHCPCTSL